MSVDDVIESQPVHLLGGVLPTSGLNLLVARHGVGKTAALVNFALETILNGGRVIHFTAGMTSEKTHNYYQEIFNEYTSTHPGAQATTWAEIYAKFLVVSYLDADKMIADVESESQTIMESTGITPALILVDGLDYDDQAGAAMAQLQTAANNLSIPMLASMILHRTHGGELDLAGPVETAKPYTQNIVALEPTSDSAKIQVEFIDAAHSEILPFYFCSNDLIFRT